LNRKADWVEKIERDNSNQVMLKKECLEIKMMKKGQLSIKGAEK